MQSLYYAASMLSVTCTWCIGKGSVYKKSQNCCGYRYCAEIIMSTRWYPIYQKGNPQLRVFLPNFWMKLVAPTHPQPKNILEFHCSMEMTKYDVKNYLEKIYNVPVVSVRTRIKLGPFHELHMMRKKLIKSDDVKIAYVVLPKESTFEFPKLETIEQSAELSDSNQEYYDKNVTIQKKALKRYKQSVPAPGLLPWFKG